MTIEEFLDRLAKQSHRKQWRLEYGWIKTGFSECPISSFRGKDGSYFESVGKELGLSRHDMLEIVHASDDLAGCDRGLRRKLLIATGIEQS